MRRVCTLQALFYYAAALGDAKKSGDPERIIKAQREHDDYVELCLEADEVWWGITYGELSRISRGMHAENDDGIRIQGQAHLDRL